MLKALSYQPELGWQELEELSIISNLCDQSGTRVWAEADISTLTEHDVATIAAEFGLHPLAVEDAKSAKQRPKLEEYDKHVFVVVHELEYLEGQLEAVQVACFVGTRFVLALHAGAERAMQETRRRLTKSTGEIWGGSAFLMHTLLDTIVDDYQSIADDLEQEIEELEDQLLIDPRGAAQTQLYKIKQRISRCRRYALPVSRMLGTFVEGGRVGASIAIVDDQFGAYFRDVHDHTLRIADQIRNVEDRADAMIDLVRVEAANAQNEVTKRLTAWAAIIAVPTYIASVYGMNYHLVPEHDVFGFWFAIGLMVTAAAVLFVFFRKRSWI
jgi:magnesium transporter